MPSLMAKVVYRQSVQTRVGGDASEDPLLRLRNVPASAWVH